MIGPRHHVERKAGRRRPGRRREDRDQRRREAAYHPAETPPDERIVRPITAEEVRLIASSGYPLWESLDAMQLRNRRITVAYSDLSEELARLIAGEGGRLDANWCTFATWSSKTIGAWIEDDVPDDLDWLHKVPWAARHAVRWLAHHVLRREDGASYRSLAAGNRFVFLEIGLTVAMFVETFRGRDLAPGGAAYDTAWEAYWDRMRQTLRDLSQLDPSWMLTEAPEPVDLELGMRQYYDALHTPDPRQRAELVLAGNLLIGAYEQRRVDGYVCAALALFTKRATRALVQRRTGKVQGRLRRGLSSLYARVMTRGLVLNTHDEQLNLARPLPPPPPDRDGDGLFPADLERIATPLLQALLTRYDLCDGKRRRRRSRNWTCFDDRMNYITNLFRSRQQQPSLFVRPFQPDVERALLDGRLDAGPRTPLADGPDLDGDRRPDVAPSHPAVS